MAPRTLPVLLALAALAACDVARPPGDAGADPTAPGGTARSPDCTRCHGSGADPAPPRSVRGDTATSAIAVGAHQKHLKDGLLHRAIACSECHVVPTSTAHADGAVRITFGPLATAKGAAATWDRASATCATYCHGATLGGGTKKTPVWTAGAAEAACGTCHGAPPPAPHPQSASCGSCHSGYGRDFVNPDQHVDGRLQVAGDVVGTCGSCHGIPPPAPHTASMACGSCHAGYSAASVVAATHMNGAVDVSVGCASCHGDPARTTGPREAPPSDAKGNTATTARGVGAHQVHLAGGNVGPALACTECHVLPTSTAHADGVADVALGAGARRGGVAAAWDPAAVTCTTYCHGATLAGGTAKAPLWTKVDGSQKTCSSCHGAPPPAPHTSSTACGTCHTGYTATSANLALHLNGTVDVASLSCAACHGDPARTAGPREAPPIDTRGSTATTARGVGAHQAHLTGGAVAGAVGCSECHTVPTSPSHADGAVQIAFGARARSGGVVAAWNPTAATCTTYCHGATLAGGSAKTPLWTRVDGTQKTCTSCHGAPPPAPHPSSTDCGSCHAGYSATTVNLATHVNGATDVAALSCTSCHGDAARASGPKEAPPFDTRGSTATTARGVGAHQAHLAGAGVANAIACGECHTVPTSPTHSDGAVQIAFGARARTGGLAPSWNGTALSCATTYCHGTTLAGGTAKVPVWTRVDGTQKTCSSCHGAPPPAPHTSSTACGSCHAGYTATTVNRALHLNGVKDVAAMTCTTCHGDAARARGPKEAPPIDTKGNTATTARGVGAHQAHLANSAIAGALSCSECHAVPTSPSHADGAVQIAFGAKARAGGVAAAWNPTAATCTTYCHGATLPGGTAKTPLWTRVDGTQRTCGSCHGAPPPAPHTSSTTCGSCHTGYGATTVNLATHLNGVTDVAALSCTSCHGAPPPAPHTASTACGSCHTGYTATSANPALHQNGVTDVAALTCTSCHGAPPTSGRHSRSEHRRSCGDCHGSGYTTTAVNPTLHMNGARNVGGAGTRINSWNPTTRTCTSSCHGSETW